MERARQLLGWLAVALGTSVAGFWSFWGVIEAFHEGWCKPELWQRLLQTLAYLSPAVVLSSLTLLGIRWPRVGGSLAALTGIGIAALIIIDGARFSLVILLCITLAPALFGFLFFFGRPRPRAAAIGLALGAPALITIAFGIEPVWRVSHRLDDGDRGVRLIRGEGVNLLWAPAGPGWSRDGNVRWSDAVERARYLTADGLELSELPQNIWRLPTRQEVVCSLTRGNQTAGGTWDNKTAHPRYMRKPDKESPLWDPYAPLIYLWTSDEADATHAWIVVYHGGAFPKPKSLGSSSLGFRAVRDPPAAAQGVAPQ